MVCIFCKHLTSVREARDWICSLCMRNLARELHVEEKLGVKKIETDVVDPKKEIDRIKSDFTGSGRGVGLIFITAGYRGLKGHSKN